MQSLRFALLVCSLAGSASAQFIPGVTTTTNMGTWSTYNIVNLTNGLGLSSMSLSATHSATWQEMWITNQITTGWLQFDFGSVQPLSTIAVWNYNSSISTQRGVALMDVSTSIDGVNWTPLSREAVPQANATPVLPHLIGVGGVPAQHVRFDVLQNHGNNYTGLSEVQFVAGGGGAFGSNTSLGRGCIRTATSFYEYFPVASSFDLANSAFTMVPNGPGWFVIPGASTYRAPSAAAAVLTLQNNSEASVALTGSFPYPGGSTTSLTVCSNGFVAVATGNGTASLPVAATMLNATRTGWWAWHDYDPAAVGGGRVKFEQMGTLACITWDGVWDSGGTSPANASTFQFQFDTVGGLVHVVFGAMSGLVNGHLVGYSPGGPSVDHGSVDLSAAVPGTFPLGATDVLPLTLTGVTRPVLGSNWNFSITNIPAGAILGFDVWGMADAAVQDLGFMGAPGCGQRASLDFLSAWVPAGAARSYGAMVPSNPALAGWHVFTTQIVLQPGVNSLLGGAITSNGIDGRIGTM